MYPSKTPVSSARQHSNRLNQWLSTQLELPAEGRPFIRVESGLFIDESGLQRMIGQYAMYASVEGLLKSLTEFFVTKNGELIVRYRPKRVESREIHRGIVLAETYLTEEFKQLRVCQDFVPDFFAHE